MKIAFLCSSIFSLGGVQRVVTVLANGLARDNEVTIICTAEDEKIRVNNHKLSESINVKIENSLIKKDVIRQRYVFANKVNRNIGLFNNYIGSSILENIYYPIEIKEKVINYFNNNNYDVVIGVEGYYILLLGIISEKLNLKTIGWQHNSFEAYLNTYKKYQWKQDILFKKYLPKLNKHIVLTDSDKNTYKKKMGIEVERIYNPLSFISDEKSNCTEKIVLSVGRLVKEQKGLDMMIKAFKYVASKHNDWKLIMVGDGPDKEELFKLIKENNLEDNIEIHSSTNDIQKYYRNSSIFVSTSRWEGFGLVLTEAMECGLPVIAFNNTGPKEIINSKKCGILVEKNDINGLANEICTLIENKDKRLIISKNAIKRANDFKVENILSRWNELLNNL